MSRYHLTADAEADLEAITDYYADKSPTAGQRVIRTILRGCELRAAQRLMGSPRDDLGPGVRSFVASPYVVFFRPVADGIEVLRVLHGARDIGPNDFAT